MFLSGLYHYDGYHDDTEVSAVSHDLRVMKTKLRCYLDDLKRRTRPVVLLAAPMINNNNYFLSSRYRLICHLSRS